MTDSWIPISKDYPPVTDEYKKFLVTYSDKSIGLEKFLLTIKENKPYFSGGKKVIAWMPSPKAYDPDGNL